MSKLSRSSLIVFLFSFLGTVMLGCLDKSEAGGGVSQAAFDELKATVTTLQQTVTGLQQAAADLQGKVTALETEVAATKAELASVKAGGNVVRLGASSSGSSKMLSAALTDTCAYLGYLPADKPSYQATSVQCRSNTGYLFALPAPNGGKPLPVDAFYQAPGCTGQAYVHRTSVSDYGRAQGAVFTYSDAVERFQVGYVPAGAELLSGTMESRLNAFGVCQNVTTDFSAGGILLVVANDEGVTAVSSQPYPGPVTIIPSQP